MKAQSTMPLFDVEMAVTLPLWHRRKRICNTRNIEFMNIITLNICYVFKHQSRACENFKNLRNENV